MPKGLELPISVVVIISLAVLVLIIISSFFLQNVGEQQKDIKSQSAFFQACNEFRSLYSCDKEKMPDKLKSLCDKEGYTADSCMVRCGCMSVDQLPAGTQTRTSQSSQEGTQSAAGTADVQIFDA